MDVQIEEMAHTCAINVLGLAGEFTNPAEFTESLQEAIDAHFPVGPHPDCGLCKQAVVPPEDPDTTAGLLLYSLNQTQKNEAKVLMAKGFTPYVTFQNPTSKNTITLYGLAIRQPEDETLIPVHETPAPRKRRR